MDDASTISIQSNNIIDSAKTVDKQVKLEQEISEEISREQNNEYSIETHEKSAAAKIYFEQYFDSLSKNPLQRYKRRVIFEKELENMNIPDSEKQQVRQSWLKQESDNMRMLRQKIAVDSFEVIKILGKGAFGVVKLVKEKDTGELFAMKIIRKDVALKKRQEGHVRAERDFLIEASESSKWIVKLVYSFQDNNNLYMGGDLLTLLIRQDVLNEDMAKFYAAEMVCAIAEAHQLGYIHRDVKPDNFLFEESGHLKLSDFGLATNFHWTHDAAFYDLHRSKTQTVLQRNQSNAQIEDSTNSMAESSAEAHMLVPPSKDKILDWRDRHRKQQAYSIVGTNNYMAVEVIQGKDGYDELCDWWSFGVILYEMLYGFPPFCSSSKHNTKLKILRWKQTLKFPDEPVVSNEAKDLIEKLLCDPESRLGRVKKENDENVQDNEVLEAREDIEQIKAHPFFAEIDWENIRTKRPPFVPDLKSSTDTSYFDEVQESNSHSSSQGLNEETLTEEDKKVMELRKEFAFVGFTFRGSHRLRPRYLKHKQNEEDAASSAVDDLSPSVRRKFPRQSVNSQESRKVYCNVPVQRSVLEKNRYCSNEIKTTKYTVWTFLPKNMFEQFRRVANFYFLFMIVLQAIPELHTTDIIFAAAPIVIIVLITAAKDGFEDYKRHKSDNTVNNETVLVLNNWKNVNELNERHPSAEEITLKNSEQDEDKNASNGAGWRKIFWKEIKVGDILRLENNYAIPADLIILSTTEPDSVCYVETKNLDGETNLKIRRGPSELTWLKTDQDCRKFKCTVESEAVTSNLYMYNGRINVINEEEKTTVIPVNINNLLLRGCFLRNTSHIIGIVVSTGVDTKLMLNSGPTPSKRSKIDRMLNPQTGTLTRNVMELKKISVAGAIYGFTENDLEKPIRRFNSSENAEEEENFADLDAIRKKMMKDMTILLKGKNVSVEQSFVDPFLFSHLLNIPEQSRNIIDFFRILSVCHTVLSQKPNCSTQISGDDIADTKYSEIIYKAQSPDEAALVSASRNLGFSFLYRENDFLYIDLLGKIEKYKILNVLEFNSSRKRMSVIVQRMTGEILLYCKGADSVIYERLAKIQKELESETLIHLESFAQEVIDADEYESWSLRYSEASSSLKEREILIDKIASEIENNLILVGATAIEDKLQEGVPETIELLGRAGMKIWVLTGDKMETAINIGFSCNLLRRDMLLLVIKGSDAASTEKQIKDALDQVWGSDSNDARGRLLSAAENAGVSFGKQNGKNLKDLQTALIIDGHSLKFALEPSLRNLLLELGCKCKAVICCRVSPLQKAQVVELVKHGKGSMTLAIGDGANDVSMIQAADIGVGIAGEEGVQATMAIISLAPRIILHYIQVILYPSDLDIVREIQVFNLQPASLFEAAKRRPSIKLLEDNIISIPEKSFVKPFVQTETISTSFTDIHDLYKIEENIPTIKRIPKAFNFALKLRTLKNASSIFYMRTGQFEKLRGFGFSQEEGMKDIVTGKAFGVSVSARKDLDLPRIPKAAIKEDIRYPRTLYIPTQSTGRQRDQSFSLSQNSHSRRSSYLTPPRLSKTISKEKIRQHDQKKQ
ncbi:Serine/threonine-dual specificity kinase domain-containing protein [Rozella allomycis CSF55]|uniref:Phospholipid-transporting ATPase n=1 Tax=Rozella allomycis (strain CSF55) TaxID=988480 RepID=A0A075AR36_ROZAC|nr:Serine/threonine-dual specificity kinase domain-containing protein [Rozella allomycis CSF55]|eukprot:EPZ32698.1 Serine/threonine-dual specificity kinase domain-containing protein [Rozella allomycis CSF55]